ncbi:MAG: bifunctional methylenetetrahydrofolate dehydrogenase/methenyltetrahydrofolate cyclohydrolase FolD [Pseudomonadota bacterium]
MILLDGKKLAERIQKDVAKGVAELKRRTGATPGLAAVQVGDNEASKVYVQRKTKACAEVGMYSRTLELPGDLIEEALVREIEKLNADPMIHGILVQLPLPKHIAADRILSTVSVGKDVDGFHVVNAGKLAVGRPGFVPCTPLGILRLLDEYKIPIEGAEAVIVGRSNIVGKPMAQLLLSRHAVVTICHSRTRDLKSFCRRADILVAAVGRPRMIAEDWIKDGAAVIDVGMNRLDDGKLVGDVDFEAASKRAGWITPVPGGVGPLTIAMLLSNTLKAAQDIMEVG